MFYKLSDITDHIINYSNEKGYKVSNLKLQKLLYYIQAEYLLKNNGEAMFQESIVNWRHGPVVEEVYHSYKNYGSRNIDRPNKHFNIFLGLNQYKELDKYAKRIIENVVDQFSECCAWDMVEKTHSETPWKNTNNGDIISNNSIYDFMRTVDIHGNK